jgi:hypothetical protein
MDLLQQISQFGLFVLGLVVAAVVLFLAIAALLAGAAVLLGFVHWLGFKSVNKPTWRWDDPWNTRSGG